MLVLVTVVGLGTVSYRNARFTAEDLSTQILEQTSQRVDVQINSLLLTANAQGRLNQRLSSPASSIRTTRQALVRYWLEVMAAQPAADRACRMAARYTASGSTCAGDRTASWPSAKCYAIRRPITWNCGTTGRTAILASLLRPTPSWISRIRVRPWYRDAQANKQQTWSETYIFFGTKGGGEVPGTGCTTPVYDSPGGELRGVLTSSFDLAELCTYLKELNVSRSGFAFVTEFRRDGSRRIIAYPDQSVLLRSAGGSTRELVPPEVLSDKRSPGLPRPAAAGPESQQPEGIHPRPL